MTQEELHKLLEYKPITGEFFWKIKPAKQIPIGALAGYTAKNGYTFIRISGVLYYAHRLAVLYMTGAFPKHLVDHDNRVRSDNRWINLIPATYQDNQRNAGMSLNNTSGVTGVGWDKKKQRWYARITVNAKGRFLGYFDNIPDAAAARKAAERALGFHPNHGVTP